MATAVAARMQALIRASTHGDNAHAEVRAHPSGLVGFEVYEIRSPHVVLDSLLCRLLQQAADGRQCTVEAGDVTRILVRRRRQQQSHEQGGEEGTNSNNGDGLVNTVTRVIIGRGWLREAWLHLRYAPARRLLVQWAVAGAVCVVMPALLVGGGGGGAYDDYYGDDGDLGNSGGGGGDAHSAKARTAAAVANLVYRAFLACAAVATLPAAVVLAIIGF